MDAIPPIVGDPPTADPITVAHATSGRSAITIALDVAGPVALFALVEAARRTDRYRQIVGEDGLLEWAQVVGFAITAWALFSAARRSHAMARVALAGCGLIMVGVIGEELAWGTRLLRSGVEFIEDRNVQGDTTLHNLEGGLELSFFGIAAIAFVLALAVASRRGPLGSAPWVLVWWLVVPAIYAVYRLRAGDVPYHVAKLSEAAEVIFACAVARLALHATKPVRSRTHRA
jgi:hypothetical protein